MDLSRIWCLDQEVLPSAYDKQDCFLARALEIVGERWTFLVLRDAFYGARRFGDFHAHLDMPRTVLSTRLRTLVEAGVMHKTPDPGHAGRWLYELTERGLALWPALYSLRAWGERVSSTGTVRRVFVHDACGEKLSDNASCERCGVVPDPRSVLVRPVNPPSAGARTDPVAIALRQPHRLLDPISSPEDS